MRRLRIALLLLVVAITIPVVLLVSRALQSVEFERRARQAALAERVIDEMERALSAFLAGEESRPAESYRFYAWLDAAAGQGERIRSPLSRPDPQAFVIAHYQLDPDGRVYTPLQPRDLARARAAGDWPAPVEERSRVERGVAEVDRWVAPFWRTARPPRLGDASADEDARLSKRTAVGRADDAREQTEPKRVLGSADLARAEGAAPSLPPAPAPDALREEEEAPASKLAPRPASAYDALKSFNRGAAQRKSRQSVVKQAPRSQIYPAGELAVREGAAESKDSDEFLRFTLSERPVPLASREWSARAAAPPSPYASAMPGLAELGAGRAAPAQAAAPERAALAAPIEVERARDTSVRIIIDPMSGVALGERRMLLYRTVLVDGVGYRQGLLIDEQALGRWLEETIIAPSGLAETIDARFGDAQRSRVRPDTYLAEHVFAEPFDGLALSLAIAPLVGTSQARTIYALVVLLAVVGIVGLLAVDRMAAVVVEFAERRGNFVSAVSHELKTPLTAIRMYAEMLRDGLVLSEAKRAEYHATISDESERLSRLIDNVLEFSRLERGKREFALVVGALGDAVGEAAEKLLPQIERAGFALTLEVEPDLPAVRFDRDALTQMVFNLIDNAMKYAALADERRIVLRCGRDADGRIGVSVRDFGPGISRRHLARVFEPFYRGEAELTRVAKGSGIGLALVRDLAEAMGAIVRGENVDGGGFEVTIAFRAVAVEAG